MAVFRWSRPATLAAQLLAESELTYPEIAEKCGVVRQTLYNWRQQPEFKARVQEEIEEYVAVVRRRGIARLEKRVDALNDRWRRMQRVIEARAQTYADDAHGAETGLLCRTVRWEGTGDDRRAINEYEFDAALAREMREHEKQAAQELGQWTEKRELSGDPDHPVVVKVVKVATIEEL
jgi:transposase-like protein